MNSNGKRFVIQIDGHDINYFPNEGNEIFIELGIENTIAIIYNYYIGSEARKCDALILVPCCDNDSIYEWLSSCFDMPYIIKKTNEYELLGLDDGFPACLRINEVESSYTLISFNLFFQLLYGESCVNRGQH